MLVNQPVSVTYNQSAKSFTFSSKSNSGTITMRDIQSYIEDPNRNHFLINKYLCNDKLTIVDSQFTSNPDIIILLVQDLISENTDDVFNWLIIRLCHHALKRTSDQSKKNKLIEFLFLITIRQLEIQEDQLQVMNANLHNISKIRSQLNQKIDSLTFEDTQDVNGFGVADVSDYVGEFNLQV